MLLIVFITIQSLLIKDKYGIVELASEASFRVIINVMTAHVKKQKTFNVCKETKGVYLDVLS